MDPIKSRKYPEVWPFIPETTNVPIDEDKMYAFFDAGMILGDVYDSNITYDDNVEKFKRVLDEQYGFGVNHYDDISTNPEELGWKTVIMTGRQFVDQLYKIEPTNDDFILSVGRWSNMTEEDARKLLDDYYDNLFGIKQG